MEKYDNVQFSMLGRNYSMFGTKKLTYALMEEFYMYPKLKNKFDLKHILHKVVYKKNYKKVHFIFITILSYLSNE